MRRWNMWLLVPYTGLLCACVGVNSTPGKPAQADIRSNDALVIAPAEVNEEAALPEQQEDPTMPSGACVQSEEGAWQFLNHFVYSDALRTKYTDERAINAGVDPVNFEVTLVDHRWAYAESGKNMADYPRVNLKLDFDVDKFELKYTRAKYSPDDEQSWAYGSTGRYSFAHLDGCWKLVSHHPIR